MPARRFVRVATCLAVFFFFLTSARVFARPLGVDVSSYQGPSINWATAKANGISFAWAKATEGLTVDDADFTINMANAKAAGVLIGAYHFAHPELRGPSTEIDHFWSVAGNYIANGGFYLQPVLDYENFTTVVGAASISDWANQWCIGVSNKAYAKGVIVHPIVYVSVCHACNYDSTVTQWIPWLAGYPASADTQNGTPWYTCTSCEKWGAGVWTIWQYTDSAPLAGATQNADGDVFNGTMTQLTNKLVIGAQSAPTITSSPSNRNGDRGGSLVMRVEASGLAPLKYQWRFNNVAIAGATNSTFTLTNIQTTSAGSYTAVVTNTVGTTTSGVALLTVNQPFLTAYSENFETNNSANWTINTSGTDNRVTFAYDYSVIGIPAAPNSVGTTKGLRLEANLTKTNAAAVSLSPLPSPNFPGFSGNYRLHFDMWINVNGPLQGPATGGGGGSTEGITAGVGTGGNRIEWTGASSTADAIYFFADGDGDVGDTSTTLGDFAAFKRTVFQTTASNVYTAGIQTTADQTVDAYYQNVYPGGQSAPAFQQSNYPQQTGALAPGAVGLGWHDVVVYKGTTAVDWFIDGLKIASVSSSSLAQSNVTVGYWDPFSSLSDNTNLSFGLVDNLRVEIEAVAPAITAQPSSTSVALNSNKTFTVTATGTPAPTYQWRFNGTAIPNATTNGYTVSNAQTTDAGSYSVIVSNVAGSVTSSSTLLTVILPPTLTSQPASQTVN
ncbi:MAG: glycoside hydrolase family 25, partial [Verrucomicrobiales bacterium]|nr:glycoside hydrolase family 25 [Verrucomicrobiales bacterium]